MIRDPKSPLLSYNHDGNVARKALQPIALRRLASSVRKYDIEEAFRIRLTSEWSRMRCREKAYAASGKVLRVPPPRKPRALFRLLSQCFVWPMPEYIISPAADHMKLMTVDKAFDGFVAAAKRLRAAVPDMQRYEPLLKYMEDRLPDEEEGGGAASLYLYLLQGSLPCLARAPKLNARIEVSKPTPVKEGFVRDVVRAVCWYLVQFEGEEPTRSEAGDGLVTSRVGILSQIALEALEISYQSSVDNHLRAVMEETGWRQPTYGWWDNLPKSARPS